MSTNTALLHRIAELETQVADYERVYRHMIDIMLAGLDPAITAVMNHDSVLSLLTILRDDYIRLKAQQAPPEE